MARDWVNEVREAMQVPEMPNIFVLGSFERRVTIYSQQVRALNLLSALLHLDQIGSGKHVAVIGAGVAGLTFAAAAARKGVDVTVLEKEDRLLPLFRHAPNRWLHPRVYDWPMPGWNHSRAGLPVLDWEAGTVAQVAHQFEEGWKGILAEAGPRIHEFYHAQEVKLLPTSNEVWVSWNERPPNRRPVPHGQAFAIVVLAVGFGLEETALPSRRGYWEPDDLDSTNGFLPSRDEPQTWLVSGSGDGALTDLLRLCIVSFQHDQMVNDFISNPSISPIVEQIRKIEDNPRARDPNQPRFLHEAYQELKAQFVVELLQKRQREDTRVTLNAENPFYFQRDSSVLNRFLVAQLRHAGGFEFVPGKVVDVREEGRKWRVEFDDRTVKFMDRIVLRHGPRPTAMEAYFPAIWDACKARRDYWKQAPHLLDQTRRRYWEEGAFGTEERLDDHHTHASVPEKPLKKTEGSAQKTEDTHTSNIPSLSVLPDSADDIHPQLMPEQSQQAPIPPHLQAEDHDSELPPAPPSRALAQLLPEDIARRALANIDHQKKIMTSVATNEERIGDVEHKYTRRARRLRSQLKMLGLEDPNPYDSLWSWHERWKNGPGLGTYALRRQHVIDIYKNLVAELIRRA